MMWKVIAADDEGYIREALQKLIDWRKMNCVLEAVVCDGQALIDQIREGHPDIVISDILLKAPENISQRLQNHGSG